MSSLTLKRLESLSLRELSILLQNDPKNKNLSSVTITEVRITNDLSFMTIYYSSYGDLNKDEALALLEENKSYIRTQLAHKIKARKMPELLFKYDEALEYGNHINSILADLKKENK